MVFLFVCVHEYLHSYYTHPSPTYTCMHTQIAESTKEHLEFHGLTFEYRGAVKMKGKGEVRTYFVTKKK